MIIAVCGGYVCDPLEFFFIDIESKIGSLREFTSQVA